MVLDVMADKPTAEMFGEWLSRRREEAGITLREAARRAGISEGQWSRIERGLSGTKRSTIPLLLDALKIPKSNPLYSEGYRTAGYSVADAPIVSERLDADPCEEDPLAVAWEAFYLGTPPELRPTLFGEVARLVRDHQRLQTHYGRRTPEEADARIAELEQTKRDAIDEIKRQVDEMQRKIAQLRAEQDDKPPTE